QLDELLVGLLEFFAVGVQFEAQGELAKTLFLGKPGPNDHNQVHQRDEVKVVHEHADLWRHAVHQSGADVDEQYEHDGNAALEYRPVQHGADGQQNEIEAGVVWRGEAFLVRDHAGDG